MAAAADRFTASAADGLTAGAVVADADGCCTSSELGDVTGGSRSVGAADRRGTGGNSDDGDSEDGDEADAVEPVGAVSVACQIA